MFIIISPAKTLDFESPIPTTSTTHIRFPDASATLVDQLKKLTPSDLSDLMSISPQLSQLNHHRYQTWQFPFDSKQTRAALFAFKGDVFTGIDATSLKEKDIDYSQTRLRMLSGLYGLLRPLDAILPYRLEMGTKFKNDGGKNLYEFWGDTITQLLKQDMDESNQNVLVNLASNEYFKSIKKKALDKHIVTPVFKDLKNGHYKVISFYAKKARGLMTRFIIQNQLKNPDDLTAFSEAGYYFHPDLSKKDQPVFVRDHTE